MSVELPPLERIPEKFGKFGPEGSPGYTFKSVEARERAFMARIAELELDRNLWIELSKQRKRSYDELVAARGAL